MRLRLLVPAALVAALLVSPAEAAPLIKKKGAFAIAHPKKAHPPTPKVEPKPEVKPKVEAPKPAAAPKAEHPKAEHPKAEPKPKVHAHLIKKHPLPQLPGAKATPAKEEKKEEPKSAAKKAEPDPNEPPPELTGSLPQAKLANKKKADGKDAKDSKDAKDPKKADAKIDPKAKKSDTKSDTKADAKSDAKSDDKTTAAEIKADLKSKDAKGTINPKDEKGVTALTPMTPAALAAEFGALHKKATATDKKKMKACLHPAVTFARLGQPTDVTFVLTTCQGGAAPGAVESLSILARPYDKPAPTNLLPLSVLSLPKKGLSAKPSKALGISEGNEEIAPGIRRIDPGLVHRVQSIADHFPGKTITLVSGYRPASKGSPHAAARAFDMRIDGVTNEALVSFCKTLPDTGCGYYPNSYFVHVDVRVAGAGHVYWIDTSGPGEKPNYVKSWPPPLPSKPTPGVESPKEEASPSIPATTDAAAIGIHDDDDDRTVDGVK